MPFDYSPAAFLPFRDAAECGRVRVIPRARITEHPNPDFRIAVLDDRAEFYQRFAHDLVTRIRSSRDEGRHLVLILPVGPVPQYELAAEMINRDRLSMHHVHTFNMDEYADDDGNTAPAWWPGSFQRSMWERFFGRIDPELRPPEAQIHFPTGTDIGRYSDEIDEAGGADVCYGGVGWSGHMAFWEPHLADDYADLAAYRQAGARLVELHPMTVMQSALHSFGGDWSWVPPRAVTVGPRDILGARLRSFWLDGDLGGGVSWQRFIARLVAHGPVTPYVPASLLQEVRTDLTLLAGVADDVQIAVT
jgi:glucosamine-6-phosphate deaminase